MELKPGAKLGPYEIVSPIGAGGMGEVYKARDPRLDRIVALKVSKAEFTERFSREARTVAQLNHAHVCTLHDVGPTAWSWSSSRACRYTARFRWRKPGSTPGRFSTLSTPPTAKASSTAI
jgi:serine/threonine protein kinase